MGSHSLRRPGLQLRYPLCRLIAYSPGRGNHAALRPALRWCAQDADLFRCFHVDLAEYGVDGNEHRLSFRSLCLHRFSGRKDPGACTVFNPALLVLYGPDLAAAGTPACRAYRVGAQDALELADRRLLPDGVGPLAGPGHGEYQSARPFLDVVRKRPLLWHADQ